MALLCSRYFNFLGSCWGYGVVPWAQHGMPPCALPHSAAPRLQLITLGDVVGADVRLAVAVNFKNYVKYRWVSDEGWTCGDPWSTHVRHVLGWLRAPTWPWWAWHGEAGHCEPG